MARSGAAYKILWDEGGALHKDEIAKMSRERGPIKNTGSPRPVGSTAAQIGAEVEKAGGEGCALPACADAGPRLLDWCAKRGAVAAGHAGRGVPRGLAPRLGDQERHLRLHGDHGLRGEYGRRRHQQRRLQDRIARRLAAGHDGHPRSRRHVHERD